MVRIQTTSGTGSGVIFETDGQSGYVITNHHVVEGKGEVDVIVSDTATYRGTVLGVDSVRDLAVVRICCGTFRKLAFGNASDLDPGAEVINIGYAMGLQGPATITKGIVSAVRYDSRREAWVIQTDAPINPGNSGGPMLSPDGKVLGINTFKISETSVEGLGFAISQATVQRRIPLLRAGVPRPTPAPTSRPRPTPSAGVGYGFGPVDGELRHDPSDEFIKTEYADVSVADMIVTATFVNPYSASSSSWDYGFFIRDSGSGSSNRFIQAVVTSERGWSLSWREGSDSPNTTIAGGTLTTFDTSAGGRNDLHIVAIGERGWFFVNGEFISSLDLSDVTGAGDIAVITGAFTGDEVSGAVTRFENFKGNRLARRYGPAEGRLETTPESVGLHVSGVSTRDLVVEANFVSPPGSDWYYSFTIRGPDYVHSEYIGLHGTGWWFHQTSDDDDYPILASGYLSSAGTTFLASNHLLIIAIEEAGWFFVNGQLVAKLDLDHNQNHGQVTALSGFFDAERGSVEFENFNVWAP